MANEDQHKLIHRALENATVKIWVANKFQGTGFFITPDGYLLTAYHCVGKELAFYRQLEETPPDIFVETRFSGKFKAQLDVNKSLESSDIAVLKVEHQMTDCVPLGWVSHSYKEGKIVALGYPAGHRPENQEIAVYQGTISRFCTNQHFETEAIKGQGQSGGPVYHYSSQRVIGLTVTGYDPKKTEVFGIGRAVQFDDLFQKWLVLETINAQVAKSWETTCIELTREPEDKQVNAPPKYPTMTDPESRSTTPLDESSDISHLPSDEMNLIVAYETSEERWIARVRGFVQWFYQYRKWHIPIGFFFLSIASFEVDSMVRAFLVAMVWTFLGLYAVCWGSLFIARKFTHPYPLPPRLDSKRHVLDGFAVSINKLKLHKTEPGFPRYSFRSMQVERITEGWERPNSLDIEAFVDFGQRALEEAHPTLSREERRKVYLRWWECRQNAFLLLERLESSRKRRIIAISIILPLTEIGFKVLVNGDRGVLDLGPGDITSMSDKSRHLLIDTWIVRPADRHKYTGYEYALVLKHLSLFWDPSQQEEMTILVEPDVASIRKLAQKCNFHGPRPTKNGGHLYTCHFPGDDLDAQLQKYLHAIKENITTCITIQN